MKVKIKLIFMHLVSRHARSRIFFDLFHGLKLERYELSKSEALFNHFKS